MEKKYEIMCGACQQKIEIEVKEGKTSLLFIECNNCGMKIDCKKKMIKETREYSCKVEEIMEKPQDPQLDIPFTRNVDIEPEKMTATEIVVEQIKHKEKLMLAAPEEEIQPIPYNKEIPE